MLDLVAQPAGGAPHRRALHQPQPRRDLEDVRPRRRALRGPARRGRAGRDACCRIRATRTPSACCAASRAAACARTTGGSTRSPASCRASAPRSPGCVFADRCALADDRCRTEEPPLPRRRAGPSQPLLLSTSARRICRARRPRTSRSRAVDRTRRAAAALRRPRQGVPPARAGGARARRRVSARSGRARPSGSSASRAAARRRSPAPCSGSSGRRPVPSSSRGAGSRRRSGSARASDLRALQIVFQNPDSALNRRHSVRRILLRSLSKLAGVSGAAADARVARARRAGSALRAHADAEAGAALRRPQAARRDRTRVCRRSRSSSSATSRRRRSTSRCRRRSSTCSSSCRPSSGVSYLFISHDLGVVRYISDRIAVLYLGRLMELGPGRGRLRRAAPSVHRGAALGRADGRRRRPRADQARGRDPERGRSPPSGCVFHTRCPRKLGAICDETEPPLVEVEHGHLMRCHIPIDELRARCRRSRARGRSRRA